VEVRDVEMVGTRVAEGVEHGSGRLAELYERHAAGAVRLAYLITGDRERARDVAQEAFVRVATAFRHRRFPDAFDAYLRRTVINLCTSHFRRARLERAVLEREAAEPPRVDATSEPGVRDELRRALRRLPERQRVAVVLRYYEDLSEEDMARAMRCSVPAARSLLSRGMQTLRTIVDREDR
jgi:RNA polymerase sigma-70 factor (sigma-E family)